MMVISYIVNTTYLFLWDVIVDWGLLDFKAKDNPGLRDELVYRFRAYYYCAMLEDLIIRFSWILIITFQFSHRAEVEIVRTRVKLICCAVQTPYPGVLTLNPSDLLTLRSLPFPSRRIIWNFFRLENEHLNNCGHYRAVRDIFIVPMHRNTPGTMNKNVMQQVAAAALQNGRVNGQQYTRFNCCLRRDDVGHQPVPEERRSPKNDDAPVKPTLKADARYRDCKTLVSAESKNLWRSFQDVCSKACNEPRRKLGVVVGTTTPSVLCVVGAHCHMHYSAPNTPGSLLRTKPSSPNDKANLRGGVSKELTGGDSQDVYFSDWEYEPRLGEDWSTVRSSSSQGLSIHAAAGATHAVVPGHPCRLTLEAIVNQPPSPLPPVALDRRRRTVHYDEQEMLFNDRPRRASAQATISLQPDRTKGARRTQGSETGESSAAAASTYGTSVVAPTQLYILVPPTSSDSSADNARPSGRGRNPFLAHTFLPLPEAKITGGSSNPSAILSKSRLIFKRLRSVFRIFTNQKENHQELRQQLKSKLLILDSTEAGVHLSAAAGQQRRHLERKCLLRELPVTTADESTVNISGSSEEHKPTTATVLSDNRPGRSERGRCLSTSKISQPTLSSANNCLK
ncbi:unnamed protein product [Schistocephalus solidus]|uniref:EXS domain-containing protein n=1 Tax=Schistocephalus solidus TaxID=70667 RepID=A0A3P7D5M2_SCHSO|nr:unnamed protein product [Schistocephalus solidus]